MFVYHYHSTILVLFLYIDDMLLIGNSTALIHSFIVTLSTQFVMKDLGDLHYFLGVQLVYTSCSLFLSQHKYVFDLLKKLVRHTPCVSRTTLWLTYAYMLFPNLHLLPTLLTSMLLSAFSGI